ncbi:tetratricopeptide repeat protein [Streptomyces sp. NPDC000594]|uniref:tetratricopeptide repeat protein n=1 Tax=Streptomyces sp. NPDC000594 TaxID=3154261 RepID=UPI0033325065
MLLPGGLVLTCARVLAPEPVPPAARGPERRRLSRVYADFPALPGALEPLAADVVPGPDGDGAVLLRLAAPAPVPPVVLHRQAPAPGEPVRVVGHPRELPEGEEIPGRLRGPDGTGGAPGWVRIDPEVGAGPFRRGFGGGGVVHGRTGRVIGILAHPRDGGPRADREDSWLIPAESLVRRLPAGARETLVAGVVAVSDTIPPLTAAPGARGALGLLRALADWSGGDTGGLPGRGTEDVELLFAPDDDRDALAAVHAAVNLADRERAPDRTVPATGPGPRVGSIDLAVDATGRTLGELAVLTAARCGLDSGPDTRTAAKGSGAPGGDTGGPDGDTGALLARISAEAPPLTAVFLSADRAAGAGAGLLPLFTALLHGRGGRLLLVLRDPDSPLLDRVTAELLDPEWPDRLLWSVEERLRALDPRDPRLSRDRRRLLAGVRRHGRPIDVPSLVTLCRLHTGIEEAPATAEYRHTGAGGSRRGRRYVVLDPGDGLTDLPKVTADNPDGLVPAGAPPGDGTESPLRPGDKLHQQYRVIGWLAQGSYGQVYLARDQMLEDRAVALKGVRHPADPHATETALRERLRLVGLNHPSIIKVFNYARHPDHPRNTAMFIVMEFADGATLAWVAEQIARRVPPFGDERVYEFIAAYGLRILDALTYLHVERELVYGDLSLTNVVHCGDGIKLIDVAGVRPIGEYGPVTHPAPEEEFGRVTVAADLYAVGEVLRALFARVPGPAEGKPTALRRVLERAGADTAERRFATAAEMRLQLWGVLRELRSRRVGEETFEPSQLFATAPAALDGDLGKAPPLEQWRSGGTAKRRLTARPPSPVEVAMGLPVPHPDPDDANCTKLQRTSYDDPAGLLQLSGDWGDSPERSLLRCRLHLGLACEHPGGAGPEKECAAAERELGRAEETLGRLAPYDWRLDWHHGLLLLVRGDVAAALTRFDRVDRALPGEYAPKLALGYCHEMLDGADAARLQYEAVWQRNRALGGAAFGLARIHLAAGETGEALERLRAVPPDSRHRTAARTAMVRILADPPADGSPPAVAAVAAAWGALHRLCAREGLTDRLAQDRLRADLLELLLRLVPPAPRRPWRRRLTGRFALPGAPGAGRPGAGESGAGERGAGKHGAGERAAAPAGPGPLERLQRELAESPEPATAPGSERELREQLAVCYLRLYEQVALSSGGERRRLAEALVDNAYLTRPAGIRHHRRGERRRRRPFGGASGARREERA